jgi:branched-subunit amino acid ABC-type transport system permease component
VSSYLPFIVFGITAGAVYGISAMGLVLTYKTSGVFNFAHGAVCAMGAYVFYDLRDHGLPWPVAGLLVAGVFGPLSGLVLERLAVLLAPVSVAYKIVGTVGLLVALRALIELIYGGEGIIFPPFLSQDVAFTVDSVSVTWDNVTVFGIGLASAVGLSLFFRRTRLGTAMRGVVDNPNLLDMTGQAPARVRRRAWVIGSSFAAVSGVLFGAQQAQLDVNVLALLVVQAFGAATIARFQSLPMCFVGGIVVGVLQKLISKEVGDYTWLQGFDLSVPFVVLFIGLLVIPRRKLVEVGAPVKARAVAARRGGSNLRRSSYAVAFIVALLLPQMWFVGSHLPAYNQALTQVVLFVSLHLLVRTSGQISLCHVGFAAVGACAFAHAQADGVPFLLAVAWAGVVCVPLGLIVAIPAIRLSGLYLALATLGFGIFLAQYAYGKDYMFGIGSLSTERPSGFESDTKYYYVLLAFAVASIVVVLIVERSRLGRMLRALADSPIALATLGLSVNLSKMLVFSISCLLAGISGALLGSLFGSVTTFTFNYVQSLTVLAVLAISGRSTVTAAIVAPVLLCVVPNYIGSADGALWLQVGFGVAAIAAAANSQGAWNSLLSSGAARFEDRLVGPATVRVQAEHKSLVSR